MVTETYPASKLRPGDRVAWIWEVINGIPRAMAGTVLSNDGYLVRIDCGDGCLWESRSGRAFAMLRRAHS